MERSRTRPVAVWRRLAVVIAAIGALVVAGCGGSGSSNANSQGGGGGKLPSTITIGATLPLTGPGAAYGTVMKNGLQLAVDQINASGGVKGSKLKLVALDDQAQAGPAVSTAKQLMSVNGAVAIASAFTVPPLAQLPLAQRNQVPVFNGGGYDPALLGHDWLYNNILTLGQEAHAGMTYAHDQLGVKKLAVIVETDITAQSIPKIEGMWKDITGTPATTATIDQSAIDAGPQLDKVLAANPDAIYLATDGNISSLLYKQLAQRNVKVPVISSSASLAVPEATSTPSLKLYFTRQAFQPNAQFQSAYKAKYPKGEPNIYFVNYYNLAYVVKEGLEYAAANGLGSNGAALKQALDKKTSFSGCCGAFAFTKEHGSTDPAELVAIEGGKPVVKAKLPTS